MYVYQRILCLFSPLDAVTGSCLSNAKKERWYYTLKKNAKSLKTINKVESIVIYHNCKIDIELNFVKNMKKHKN